MEKMENYSRVFSIFSIEKVSILSHFMPLPCIDTRQGRECAGTDRAGSVHQVFIVQGPCRDRAYRVFFCCCMDVAYTLHRLSGAKRPTCQVNIRYPSARSSCLWLGRSVSLDITLLLQLVARSESRSTWLSVVQNKFNSVIIMIVMSFSWCWLLIVLVLT